MSSPSPDVAVLLLTRDLFFRAKLHGLLEERGYAPARTGVARYAIVELAGEDDLVRVRELTDAGTRVVAFGSHVRADLLRRAREAGARAVPNSQIEAVVRHELPPRRPNGTG